MSYWDDLLGGNIEIGSENEIDFINRFIGGNTSPVIDIEPPPPPQESEVLSGSRVAFVMTAESMFSYPDFPQPLSQQAEPEGTVVKVRTASGDTTTLDGRVYVMWDDGKLRAVQARHLKPARIQGRQASSVMVRANNLGDLSSFFSGGQQGSNELVNKSTQDLWAYKKVGESYVVERLFDSDGSPLKGV